MDYTHWVALVVFEHTDVPSGFHETFALFLGHDTALVHVTLLSTLGHQFSSTALRRMPASREAKGNSVVDLAATLDVDLKAVEVDAVDRSQAAGGIGIVPALATAGGGVRLPDDCAIVARRLTDHAGGSTHEAGHRSAHVLWRSEACDFVAVLVHWFLITWKRPVKVHQDCILIVISIDPACET